VFCLHELPIVPVVGRRIGSDSCMHSFPSPDGTFSRHGRVAGPAPAILLINLDTRQDRLVHMRSELKRAEAPFERVSAVNGGLLGEEEVQSWTFPMAAFRRLSAAEV